MAENPVVVGKFGKKKAFILMTDGGTPGYIGCNTEAKEGYKDAI